MEQDMRPFLYCAVGLVLVGFTFSRADAQEGGTRDPGAIPQNIPPAISQKPSIPPLRLSPTQRTEIQRTLRSEDTEVSFALKSTKGAQNFTPSVGTKVPAALTLHPLPRALASQIQPLKRYSYVKFKHQVLIVKPMSREIVDMFPEA
jgi:Protein of unknown function (DUF1236)